MKSYYLLIFCLLIHLAGLAQTPAQQKAFDQMLDNLLSHSVKEEKATKVMLMNQPNLIFLDAREKKEFDVSHIPNAQWVGYKTFQAEIMTNIPKNKSIIVYCSVGYRSEKIAEKLIKMGFSRVTNLYGGIFSWKQAGGKVVNSQGQATEKVHTYNLEWSKWLFRGEKVY